MATQKPRTQRLDALIDETVRPTCSAVVHRLPPDGVALLRRAHERVEQEGIRVSGAGLSRVIKREFGVSVSDDAVARYLRAGCPCD